MMRILPSILALALLAGSALADSAVRASLTTAERDTNHFATLDQSRLPDNPVALPPAVELTNAEGETNYLTASWSPSATATGYRLYRQIGTSPAQPIHTTNVTSVATLDVGACIYYVTAFNQYGESPLSVGYAYPKPLTNVYTLAANVTNWPAQAWLAPGASAQFFTVKYATNRASVVFSDSLKKPLATWIEFVVWPAFNTTRRDIVLTLIKETL